MTTREEAYHRYIQSDQWKAKKQQRLEIDHYQCQTCGAVDRLEVHHKHYRTLGHENVHTDLLTLCHECHHAITTTIRRRDYQRRKLSVTMTEAGKQGDRKHVERIDISVEITSTPYSTQRADGVAAQQVCQITESDFIQAEQNRR